MAEMTLKNIEFSIIKISVLIFVVCLLFALISLLGINSIISTANQEFSTLSQTVQTSKNRLQKRLEANNLYQTMHQKYPLLYEFSYAKPDKLRWLEQLKKQAEQLNLPTLTYNIKAREQNKRFTPPLTGDFTLYTTEIEIQAGLVHETQLLQLFDHLRLANLGLFSVEHCALSVNGQDIQFKANSPNLAAQCLIEWYEIDRVPKNSLDMGLDPTGMMP